MEKLRNISVVDPARCTGCGACAQVCPTAAIAMKSDEEGFLAPVIDGQTCIHCTACQKVCHTLKLPAAKGSGGDTAYAAYLRERKLRSHSASGGVFAKAAQTILREGGAVYGAAWDDTLTVRHAGVTEEADLKKLQGSKYVQSDTSTVFRAVRESLQTGRKTLFSGTPCQVAALYAFLGEDPENLLTMDLICHGTPSPGFFRRYCAESGGSYGQVTAYQFRTRRKIGAPKSEFIAKITYEGSTTKLSHHDNDAFFRMFLKGIMFRKSCYTCPYANLNRLGDITIGDCDSADRYGVKWQSMSASTVIIHSGKGQRLWDAIADEFDFISLDLAYEAQRNAQLSGPFFMPPEREGLFQRLGEMSWEEIQTTCALPEGRNTRLKNTLRQFIPYEMSLKRSTAGGGKK